MQVFAAPLRDMRFVLQELHGLAPLQALPPFADLTPDLCDSVLAAAAETVQGTLLPTNMPGDAHGCHFENGVVRTPPGFQQAFAAWREGGWPALAFSPRWGGQGLPETLGFLVEEMVCAANISFSLYPGLTHGAARAIEAHGSEALQQLYLPRLVSAEWCGTMCLTEAQAGSDLGLLRTRATAQPDGSFRLDGEKIFTTSGEHDLAENIVHLVLARLPDAPPGVKGISLFLVPKYLPDAEGQPGARNDVVCTRIEHKMGLRGSATCALSFQDATGWLVGEAHRGMQAMFTMMNAERLAVGVQGLGVAEAAYQSSVAYARTRLQGRAPGSTRVADPIIAHPDIRRMLLTMRATAEGFRAMAVWVAQALDVSQHAADPTARETAAAFCALLTPVVKALFTDLAFDAANLAVQVHGGHGYIAEHGVEQYVRDARIAMLYEGTNGIQALDLVTRKLPDATMRGTFFDPVGAYVARCEVPALREAWSMLQAATDTLLAGDRETAAAAACDYLRLFGLVALGFLWARAAEVAAAQLPYAEPSDAGFYQAKRATARFFMDHILPETAGLSRRIASGKSAIMQLDEAAF